MKKYIKVEAELIPNGVKIYPNNVEASFLDFAGAKILAEADTIEELCDEFVAINPNNKNANYITRAPLHSLYEIEYKKYKRIVYGAIYTDKGLIYVAKLNENGDLELV